MRKRRKGKVHRGVTLIRPNEKARTGWRARYVDPDLEKMVWETLNPARVARWNCRETGSEKSQGARPAPTRADGRRTPLDGHRPCRRDEALL